ncbi:MAG: glucan ABC transporter ATP-binding protein/ permease [Xanthobacteraceae bacterium]|nr:glucan ABC transporter ATP-binding protein/ permease [Xanthobacteraceae bacterium]
MNLVRIYARVLSLLGNEKRVALVLAAANLAIAGSQFIEPMLLGRVIDSLTGKPGDWGALAPLLIAWIVFGLFNIAAGTLIAMYSDRLAYRQRYRTLSDYFQHILQLPQAFHSDTHSGRLMKVMLQGTDALWSLWLGFFRDHLTSFTLFFVLLPLSMFLNWRLALVLIVLTIVLAALTVFVVRKTNTLQSQVEEHYSGLAEQASDALGNIALVHSFARAEAEVTGLRGVIDKLLAAQIPVLSWWAVIYMLTRASTTIAVLLIIAIGAWLNFQGKATVGEIVTFMSFSGILIDKLQSTISFVNGLFTEAPRLREFFDVLDTVPAVHDRPNATDPGRVRGQVEFHDVSFAYVGGQPAVRDLSFTASPGQTIALVGPTGAGKSTALALLHRTFDPQSGSITIDGTDVRDMKLTGLRRNIGVVFQEGLLFNRSIAENLKIGKPEAETEEIRLAAQRAQALGFIESDRHGFDSRVGERGRLLSGGERQRLAIARALLKDAPILILDEATSALDAKTETMLLAALDEVMKGRTTFVIAHRLATVRKADKILMFQDGRIVESGTFDELVSANGRFAELARAQFMAPPAPTET